MKEGIKMLFKVRLKGTNATYTVYAVKQKRKGNQSLFLVFDEGIHEWAWLHGECCVPVKE